MSPQTLLAVTSGEPGRFVVTGDHYQLVTDGTLQTGGPGIAPGARELLVVSLLTCALNAVRGGGYGDPAEHRDRTVRIDARLDDSDDPVLFGRLDLAIDVPGERESAVHELVVGWLDQCRIHEILREHFAISVAYAGRPPVSTTTLSGGADRPPRR
ncbi:hypothetical protein ACIGG9_28175 [Pseudonocardia alni]|uniref:hypothetical protein n=1 Tax=Pseudonocardia alni TaxID=33907 RepID=UPI0033FCC85C